MSLGVDFDTKERVRLASDIVDVVGAYLTLRRQGRNFVASCPWHDDRRPSLQVNPQRQSWKCWVCDIGGDVFSFVQKREGVEFPDALRILAEKAGIDWRQKTGSKSNNRDFDERQAIIKACGWAEQQFHRYLLESPDAQIAREYLAERGILEKSILQFQVGFSPNEWNFLTDRARGTPHSSQILESAGLLAKSEQSGRLYDRFKGRVMFPIRDVQQRTIAFGGRVLPAFAKIESEQRGREPAKYINSPETKVFSKSENLYGLNLTRDAVSKKEEIFVMEGYTDVIMAWQGGLDNCAAVLGTALNERHVKLLRRYVNTVFLVLDGDAAGQKRTNEILDLFVGTDIDLRIMTLPDQMDPFDYFRKHTLQEFLSITAQAMDSLEHKVAVATRGIDLVNDTHRANQALENILQTLSRAPKYTMSDMSGRLREQQMLTKLARLFHLQEQELRLRLEELKGTRKTDEKTPVVNRGPLRIDSLISREAELLEIMLLEPNRIDLILERIDPILFGDTPAKAIFDLYCEAYFAGRDVSAQAIMTELEDPSLKSLLVDLDERAQRKIEAGKVEVEAWLKSVLTAFERETSYRNQRKALMQLGARSLSPEAELEFLEQLLSEKQREQDLRQGGSSTGTDP